MPKIDKDFLLQRLTPEKHGERAALARAMGIEQNKLSKILSGTRQIKADEITGVLKFFDLTLDGDTPRASHANAVGFSESDAEPFTPAPPGLAVLDALAAAGARPRHSQSYRINRDFIGFALLRGDVLLIDIGSKPAPGDIVIATLSDIETDEHATVLRRYVDGWLVSDQPSTPPMKLDEAAQNVGIVGVLRGSYRR